MRLPTLCSLISDLKYYIDKIDRLMKFHFEDPHNEELKEEILECLNKIKSKSGVSVDQEYDLEILVKSRKVLLKLYITEIIRDIGNDLSHKILIETNETFDSLNDVKIFLKEIIKKLN